MSDVPLPRRVLLPDGSGGWVTIGGATLEEQNARIAEIYAEWQERQRRGGWPERLADAASALMDENADFIARFGGLPGNAPIEGYPNAGIEWGPLTASQKAEVLRFAATKFALHEIQFARVLMLLGELMRELAVGNADVVVP